MHILHVVAPSGVGGLERVVQTLAAAQHAVGHRVHVAAVVGGLPAAAQSLFADPLRTAGITVHPLTLPGRAYLRERTAVAALVRTLGCEVIHTHGYRPDVVDAAGGRRAGAAAVTTVHGFTGGGWRDHAYEWLQRRAFRRFDAVVAVSEPLYTQLGAHGIAHDRLHLLVNAWRPFATLLDRNTARRALGLAGDAVTIGWVGRVSAEKGLDVLLDAASLMGNEAPRVAVIGDGAQRAALEARHGALRDSGRLVWCGTVPDAARHLAALDALVLSSRTEGTPMVIYEAMAARAPIIATRVGGVPNMLAPDEAMLVEPESPAALARAIRALLHDAVGARARAERAHERLVRDTDVQAWERRYAGIYQNALRHRAAA